MTILSPPELMQRFLDQSGQVVFGKRQELSLALACLLARGHLLIEDLPGLGKTTMTQAMARLLGLQFSRVQFTSDLLPADILGFSIYKRESGQLCFMPGPIFSQVLLADEINRATPKTQSALLEAMEERQVTLEGESRPLPSPFFVIATQNPVHHTGAFPLPESQLDRFLLSIRLGYPDPKAEQALLAAGDQRGQLEKLIPCLDADSLLRHQEAADHIFASPALIAYVQNLLEASRTSPLFHYGLSPRAGLGLLSLARAWAYLAGRKAVLPDDIQAVLPGIACHRLRLADGNARVRPEEVEALMRTVPIP